MKFTLIFLFSLSVFASTDQICQGFFQFKTIIKIEKSGVFLGEGENAIIRLHLGPQGEKFVIKTYKSTSVHRNTQIQNDFRALKYLKKYQKSFSFLIPDFTLLEENKVKLSYHPGRTIEDLLADKLVSEAVKTKISNSYDKMLNELQTVLHDFERIERVQDILTAETDELAMGSVHIIIKKDNVIVNPETLNLTLIDPH